MTEQPAIADPVQHVVNAMAASQSATVYVPDVELSEEHQRTLALEHDTRTLWDEVRGMWAASRGVPEEELLAHQDAAELATAAPPATEPAVAAPAEPAPAATAAAESAEPPPIGV